MATRSKLADFEVLSRLGSGSFGTVYKVRRIIDGNMYVIKNVRIVELSFKEQSEAINEVQILAQLKSPYVVRYYDSFIEKDSLHIGKYVFNIVPDPLLIQFVFIVKPISSHGVLQSWRFAESYQESERQERSGTKRRCDMEYFISDYAGFALFAQEEHSAPRSEECQRVSHER